MLTTAHFCPNSTHARDLGEGLHRVAPTFVLKYNIRTRSLADPGVIEDVLAVENDVVPFDRADVLEQGCVNAFLGDSPRSPRPCDLLACQLASRREDHGQVSIIMHVLFYAIRPCNGLDTIVSNGRKKTLFDLLLDTALKTVAYLSQVIQIVETLVRRKIRFIPIKEAIEFDGLAGPADQGDDRRRLLCCISTPIWSLPYRRGKSRLLVGGAWENKPMQRKRDGLVPIAEIFSDLGGPGKALAKLSPQARHHFTQADQVNQLVTAHEEDPDLGFMARLMALCSLPTRKAASWSWALRFPSSCGH